MCIRDSAWARSVSLARFPDRSIDRLIFALLLLLLLLFSGGGSKKGGKFSARQLSLRSFQQTVKNHANTINKASNVK